MSRPFDDRDFRVSKIFSITFLRSDITITNRYLYDFATFLGTGPYTITIPADIPTSVWPIGAYGFFNNSTTESIFMTPEAGILLNDQTGTIEIFDGANPFETPCFLVRVKVDDWHVYCPTKGGSSSGNVTGTPPTVVDGLVAFNTTDATGIRGQNNITVTDSGFDMDPVGNTPLGWSIDSSAASLIYTPLTGSFAMQTGGTDIAIQATLGGDASLAGTNVTVSGVNTTIDGDTLLALEANSQVIAYNGATFLIPNGVAISFNGGDSAIEYDTGDSELTIGSDTGISIQTDFDSPISIQGGPVSITSPNDNVEINSGTGAGDTVSLNSQTTITGSGEFIDIEQSTGTSDVGIEFKDTTEADLTRFYWDDSQARTHLDVTGNFELDSSVQMNLSGLAECSLTAGLSLTLTAGAGLFLGNSDTVNNDSMFNMVSAGPNGGREDVYYYDGDPDGNLTADFGYSLCWVTDTVTPANSGWWFLNTASNGVNTPWVQIASISHSQSGMFYGGSTPVTNLGLMVFNGTSGTNVNQVSGITAINAQMIFTARDGADVYGCHWQDVGGTPTQATLYQNSATDNLELDVASGGYVVTTAGPITLTTSTANGTSITSGTPDTSPVVTFANTGGNNGTVPFHTGNRNPNGNVNPGGNIAFYSQVNANGNSELWLNDQNNINTWVRCKGRGGPVVWGNNGVNSNTTTRYLSPGIDLEEGAGTNVANFYWVAPRDGFMRNMRIRHNVAAGNGNDIVYTLRQGGTSTALTVTVASTANNGNNDTDIVAISEGNLLNIQVTKANGVGSSPNNIICTIDFL